MNKKDELKIELISNIDEQIIEKQTLKRFRLMLKNKVSRKKIAAWCGSAAGLLIACSVLFTIIFPLFIKNVPVYTGMTVSNSMPSAQTAAAFPEAASMDLWEPSREVVKLASYSPKATVSRPTPLAALNTTSESTEEPQPQPSFPDIVGADRLLYYAKKNEDIYITVHINNPESFEILSFTLNGTKYQSYMFEAGSNSEELILKVNVGEAQGIVEYTIDAIKYVDGTEIKDVRMDGEKTVRVGVYPENSSEHPMVSVTDKVIGCEDITFTTALSDVNYMVQASEGKLYVFLYAGAEQIAQQELSISENTSVSFSDLIHGTEYCYHIVAYYDLLDGNGFAPHSLYEERFYTKSLVEIGNVQLVDEENLSFDVNITGGQNVSIQKIELLNAFGTAEYTGDAETRSFDGLVIGRYTLKVTYAYDNGETKVGYAYSMTDIAVDTLGSTESVVQDGRIIRDYSDTELVFNPSTSNYIYHRGIDITTSHEDQGVYAAFTGIVKEVSDGRVVMTDMSGNIEILYESLTNIPISIKTGSVVSRGSSLGVISGTYLYEVADPDHVHIEIRVSGENKNPMDYFKD